MNIIGKCPKCGCPIYQEEMWSGTSPPPATYICKCYEKCDNSLGEKKPEVPERISLSPKDGTYQYTINELIKCVKYIYKKLGER